MSEQACTHGRDASAVPAMQLLIEIGGWRRRSEQYKAPLAASPQGEGKAAQAGAERRAEGAPVLVFGGELAPLELRLRRQSGADGGGCEDEGGRGQHRGGGEVRTKRL